MNEGGKVRAGGASGNVATGGFTLLEVLVALAITAIAIAVVAQLFSSNLRALFASGGAVSAAVRADARLQIRHSARNPGPRPRSRGTAWMFPSPRS
jgi:prepilin-type N-terminal cleavage/methylation domain-containing protein